jgi:histidine triad (HIT) family protein
MPINTEGDVDFKKHVKLSDEEMKDTADKIFAAFQQLA